MRPLDFLIVGVQKSGTTALAEFLDEHPKIEMSKPKEVHVFDREDIVKSNAEDPSSVIQDLYRDCFQDDVSLCRGEATPVYCYFPESLLRLSEYNPGLKLVLLLRDPVERAYSHYRMEFNRDNERLSYWRALLSESARLKSDQDKFSEGSHHRRHSYRNRGYYSKQLRMIHRHFPSENVLVLGSHDMRHKHQETLDRIFSFLGLPSVPIPQREVFSSGSRVEEAPISSFLLRMAFRRDMKLLQEMIEFDISDWRRFF